MTCHARAHAAHAQANAHIHAEALVKYDTLLFDWGWRGSSQVEPLSTLKS